MSGGINLLNANTSIKIPLWGKGSVLFSVRRSYTDFLENGLYNKIYDMLAQNEPETVQQSGTGMLPGGGFGGGGLSRGGYEY